MNNQIIVDAVVIDSGFLAMGNCDNVVGGINLTSSEISNDYSDKIGHGTAVVNILLRENPDCTLYIIKITDSEQDIPSDNIVNAIKYINENIQCRLVNISMGALRVNDYPIWEQNIASLRAKGTYIVSAFDNDGAISYPAAMDGVIGVDLSTANLKNGELIVYRNPSVVNIETKRKMYRCKNLEGKNYLYQGTSMACAEVSGKILRGLADNRGQMQKMLEDSLSQPHEESLSREYLFAQEIHKAIVFPFNKEIQTLVANSDLLNFSIVGYYDYPLGIHKGRKISDVLPFVSNPSVIQSIRQLNWEGDFDTIICGHCGEYEAASQEDLIGQFIENCVKYQKKIYFLDHCPEKYSHVEKTLQGLFASTPVIGNDIMQKWHGKLRKSMTPVVGVFGTSSNQGKFTIQLAMRRELLKRGYRVGQLSTEPTGYLFGMDYVYPVGYSSTVNIHGAEAVVHLNYVMGMIENKHPDITIVGAQAGTLPDSLFSVNQISFHQFDLLMGTVPDAIILCVNVYDSVDYIIRTIQYLESLAVSKVIAICISPLGMPKNRVEGRYKWLATKEEKHALTMQLLEKTAVPIVEEFDSVGLKLAEYIEGFFGGDAK